LHIQIPGFMKKLSLLLLCTVLFLQSYGQKKVLDHDVYPFWNTIKEVEAQKGIIKYRIQPGKGDPTLVLTNTKGEEIGIFPRGSNAVFAGNFLVFHIKPQLDSLNTMRRRRVDEKKLPKDSLGIFNILKKTLTKIPDVLKFTLPKKWQGWMVYELEDSSREEGMHIIIHELETGFQDTVLHSGNYKLAREGPGLIYHSYGDSIDQPGIFVYSMEQKLERKIFSSPGTYKNLDINADQVAAFLVDRDTSKHLVSTFEFVLWEPHMDSAQILLGLDHELLNDKILSEHDSIYFSTDGNLLFFGISPMPILQDTSLLKEEISTIEVWSYKDQRLHPQQMIELEKDKNKSYLHVYSIEDKSINTLGSFNIPDVILPSMLNGTHFLGINKRPYEKYVSWEGYPQRWDLYALSLNGEIAQIAEAVTSSIVHISPFGKFAFWYQDPDSAWNIYSFESGTLKKIGTEYSVFADELNDEPNYPSAYGYAGWSENDQDLFIYDRFDIWQVNPNSGTIKRITRGRESKIIYRYKRSDPNQKFINIQEPLILHLRDEVSEQQGLASVEPGSSVKLLIKEDFRYDFYKKLDKELVYSRQNFKVFPDLRVADLKFKKSTQVSSVNPQQKDYLWGSSELYNWLSLDGQELKGILAKPANFDPSQKYPLLVNFYERSSDDLHNHRYPSPGRSTINYSFYTSRGYVIFNPDVPYRIGYPGESCYNAVIAGVNSLINEGFIDKENIGLQGHSWGGYQVSYLITKTDLFAAAEAGAPVPNMISAYGGIRWWTGLSRMFQYEHTQSRIGGTLWEYPMRYIENSPIFFIDKINTPLLIMHNDKDGHVPWYQGIELFVAMRRLQKPAWMLNYSGEPHWPLEWQNRVDFNIRLQQFFDYYLKDAPMPMWMKEGIPATEKGINLGYELENNK